MTHRITNNGKGPRGVWSKGNLVWIEPGKTKVFLPDDPIAVMRHPDLEFEAGGEVPDPPADLAAAVEKPHALDHDGDGKKGGSRKGKASTRARGAAKRRGTRKAAR